MAIDIDLNHYNLSIGESFIVDANVWIYLYSPFSNNSYGYQNFLASAQTNQCKLFVNSQIISEYINVICRTAYQNYIRANRFNSRNFKFKQDYQQTDDFKQYFQLACESVKNDILSQSKILPIKLWHIRESLNNFHQMNDYNDLVYTKMLTNKLKIVSHDRDFRNHPEDIIWLHY
ncbi:type II toxin-antitoxin system VapC family toxin [Streptococcus suis]|uniref:type II toxin-antitoxin system VapC family toxin n=1 Tax=Streptococcus suis TaxID=1307 RepID=UPI00301050B7